MMTFRLGTFLVALAALGLLMGADAPGHRLDVYFIDVMGGAATLVVTPDRESVLIDSGWPGLNDRDPKRIEHVLKDVAKLDHLDHLVTTHWHMDHYGGVEGLAKRVRIDHFWDRGLPDPDATDGDKGHFPDGPNAKDPLGIAYRKASAGKRTTLKAGDKLPLRGGIDVEILASGGLVRTAKANEEVNPLCATAPADLPIDRSDNAKSLALRFRFHDFVFLDCGDLTWNVEKQLVCPINLIGKVDLYQVTHHGMAISNHPTLIQTVAPTVAVMNNGPKKGGDAAAVKLLKSVPSLQVLYQLHKNANTGPEDNTDPLLIANADLIGGQFILASVAPDGASYQLQIGPDGPPRTFKTRKVVP